VGCSVERGRMDGSVDGVRDWTSTWRVGGAAAEEKPEPERLRILWVARGKREETARQRANISLCSYAAH
jgi:hypothetical protein